MASSTRSTTTTAALTKFKQEILAQMKHLASEVTQLRADNAALQSKVLELEQIAAQTRVAQNNVATFQRQAQTYQTQVNVAQMTLLTAHHDLKIRVGKHDARLNIVESSFNVRELMRAPLPRSTLRTAMNVATEVMCSRGGCVRSNAPGDNTCVKCHSPVSTPAMH